MGRYMFSAKLTVMEFYMKELSIFIDESGDFSVYNKISPYYIVNIKIIFDETLTEKLIYCNL